MKYERGYWLFVGLFVLIGLLAPQSTGLVILLLLATGLAAIGTIPGRTTK